MEIPYGSESNLELWTRQGKLKYLIRPQIVFSYF